MKSDSEEDVLVGDWLTSKQDLLDTSDEELNDDLLRSDDENETMRCHDESVSRPKVQAITKPYLVCKTPHLTEDQARCPKEEQTEVDPGEVLDIEINAPSGDEFQDGSELREGLSPQPSRRHLLRSCKGQPAPEKTLTRPCRSPEPVFPGQHMFDQQHSASVLDTNPLLAGPAPMGSIHPPGYESDPWRPSPALQGPTDVSKLGTPCRGHCSLQKNPSAQSGCPFTAPSGPQAQKPAVLVRAVARMVQSAKPMAVARGMPIAARPPASAKSKISAKTPPGPGMVGRNVGQKVKVKPQTPPATQKLPARLLNMTDDKERDKEAFYRQKLQEQMRLREQVIKHKERMRTMRAINKKHLRLERFQTDSSTGHWNINQNQQKQPCVLNPCPQKVTHQQPFNNPPRCSVLEHHPHFQPLPPQQHQYQILVPAHQPPWQRAPPARGNPGRAAEMQHNQPHQWGSERVVLQGMEQIPNQMNRQYSNDEAHAADPQVVRRGAKRILEQRTSEGSVPTKLTVVKHFSPGMREETKAASEKKARTVTFRMPDSSPPLYPQHGLNSPTEKRGSGPIQPQDKVAVRGNERSAFIPFSSGVKTEPVTAQTCVSFIVRLNH